MGLIFTDKKSVLIRLIRVISVLFLFIREFLEMP